MELGDDASRVVNCPKGNPLTVLNEHSWRKKLMVNYTVIICSLIFNGSLMGFNGEKN